MSVDGAKTQKFPKKKDGAKTQKFPVFFADMIDFMMMLLLYSAQITRHLVILRYMTVCVAI